MGDKFYIYQNGAKYEAIHPMDLDEIKKSDPIKYDHILNYGVLRKIEGQDFYLITALSTPWGGQLEDTLNSNLFYKTYMQYLEEKL